MRYSKDSTFILLNLYFLCFLKHFFFALHIYVLHKLDVIQENPFSKYINVHRKLNFKLPAHLFTLVYFILEIFKRIKIKIAEVYLQKRCGCL
jgi:hypothetical protein